MVVRGLYESLQTRLLIHRGAIQLLGGSRLAIDGLSWLRRLRCFRGEPLVSPMGGLPLSLRACMDEEFSRFASENIKPIIVFSGLGVIPEDTDRMYNYKHEDPRTHALCRLQAWEQYRTGTKLEDVTQWFSQSSPMTPDLISSVIRIIRRNYPAVEVIRAPYLSLAQLAYLADSTGGVYGPEVLLFGWPARVVTDLKWGGGMLEWFEPAEVQRAYGITADQFIDVALLAGCEYTSTFPILSAKSGAVSESAHGQGRQGPGPGTVAPSLLFEGAVEMVKQFGNGLAAQRFYANSGHAALTRPLNADGESPYYSTFRRVRSMVFHHPVLRITPSMECWPLHQATAPTDLTAILGPRLPPPLYYLISTGMIAPHVISTLTTGLVVEAAPVADSDEVRGLVDRLLQFRARTVGVIAALLNPDVLKLKLKSKEAEGQGQSHGQGQGQGQSHGQGQGQSHGQGQGQSHGQGQGQSHAELRQIRWYESAAPPASIKIPVPVPARKAESKEEAKDKQDATRTVASASSTATLPSPVSLYTDASALRVRAPSKAVIDRALETEEAKEGENVTVSPGDPWLVVSLAHHASAKAETEAQAEAEAEPVEAGSQLAVLAVQTVLMDEDTGYVNGAGAGLTAKGRAFWRHGRIGFGFGINTGTVLALIELAAHGVDLAAPLTPIKLGDVVAQLQSDAHSRGFGFTLPRPSIARLEFAVKRAGIQSIGNLAVPVVDGDDGTGTGTGTRGGGGSVLDRGGFEMSVKQVEQAVCLVSRVCSVLPMRHREWAWREEIDHDLSMFNAMYSAIRRALRDRIEAAAISLFMHGVLRDLQPHELATGFAMLPLEEGASTALGIVVKSALSMALMGSDAKTLRRSIGSRFPACVAAVEDVATGLDFFQSVARLFVALSEEDVSAVPAAHRDAYILGWHLCAYARRQLKE